MVTWQRSTGSDQSGIDKVQGACNPVPTIVFVVLPILKVKCSFIGSWFCMLLNPAA